MRRMHWFIRIVVSSLHYCERSGNFEAYILYSEDLSMCSLLLRDLWLSCSRSHKELSIQRAIAVRGAAGPKHSYSLVLRLQAVEDA